MCYKIYSIFDDFLRLRLQKLFAFLRRARFFRKEEGQLWFVAQLHSLHSPLSRLFWLLQDRCFEVIVSSLFSDSPNLRISASLILWINSTLIQKHCESLRGNALRTMRGNALRTMRGNALRTMRGNALRTVRGFVLRTFRITCKVPCVGWYRFIGFPQQCFGGAPFARYGRARKRRWDL